MELAKLETVCSAPRIYSQKSRILCCWYTTTELHPARAATSLKVQPEENKLLAACSSSSYQWYSRPRGSIHLLWMNRFPMATSPKDGLGLESHKKGWGTSITLLQGLGEPGFKSPLNRSITCPQSLGINNRFKPLPAAAPKLADTEHTEQINNHNCHRVHLCKRLDKLNLHSFLSHSCNQIGALFKTQQPSSFLRHAEA